MSGNNQDINTKKEEYRQAINEMGKKEFTLKKMQEYGFWPKDLPTPYEIQRNETEEQYAKKRALISQYERIVDQINKLYEEKSEINARLAQLKRKYDQTWDYEKIRVDIAKEIMQESIKRRKEKKEQRKLEKQKRHEAWLSKKENNIIFIGKGYSDLLHDQSVDEQKLLENNMPLIKTDKELAQLLGITYQELRFLVYHRDVVTTDHYHRYTVPKRKGGTRNIAAPKPKLKATQKKVLEEILNKVPISESAHGFIKGRSVVSGAQIHNKEPKLLINLDIKDFFPTITFERVRGMFKDFGYSGYIASLLAMLCTYCERTAIEVRGQTRYVKISNRILPQGAPSSPMITNIICRKLDYRLSTLASKLGFVYSRYADDMSFTFSNVENINPGKLCGLISKIVRAEGFTINEKKTRFLRPNNRQAVTGVIINNGELGVKKEWVKRLRAAIYNANKLMETGEVPAKSIHEISGMAAWLESVNADRYHSIIECAKEIINQYQLSKVPAKEEIEVAYNGYDLSVFEQQTETDAEEQRETLVEEQKEVLVEGQREGLAEDTSCENTNRLFMKDITSNELRIKFSYRGMKAQLDIDPYIFLLGKDGCVSKEEDFIFFGNPVSSCGSVMCLGEGANKDVCIRLGQVPEDVQMIAICYAIYEDATKGTFSQITYPTLTVLADDKEKLCFTVCDLEDETAMVFVELYRYKEEWKIRCVGAGYNDGLNRLCESYGIQII